MQGLCEKRLRSHSGARGKRDGLWVRTPLLALLITCSASVYAGCTSDHEGPCNDNIGIAVGDESHLIHQSIEHVSTKKKINRLKSSVKFMIKLDFDGKMSRMVTISGER